LALQLIKSVAQPVGTPKDVSPRQTVMSRKLLLRREFS